MKRNKIILDNKITGEESAGRDFGRLMKDYRRKLRFKWIKRTAVVTGVTALLFSAWFFYPGSEVKQVVKIPSYGKTDTAAGIQKASIEPTMVRRKVQPAFTGVDVPVTTKKISAGESHSLVTRRGSVMEIPAGAFTESGIVEIRYREFSDAAEILAAGVPMEYDSAGQVYPFESAGMIEVRAFEGEKELNLRKGKKIRIRLRSKRKENDFNLYRFDEEKGKWIFKGKDNPEKEIVKVNSPEEKILTDSSFFTKNPGKADPRFIIKENELVELTAPVKPQAPDPAAYQFIYRIHPDQFPELYGYKDLRFEIPASEKDVIRQINNENWDKIEVLQNRPESGYKAVFSNSTTVKSVVVNPVVSGDPGSSEMVYQSKYQEYLDKKRNLEQEIDKNKNLPAAFEEKQIPKRKRSKGEELIFRMFVIEETGIWNVDKITKWQPLQAKAFLKMKPCEGKVFVVDTKRNGVFQFVCAGGAIKDLKVPASGKFYMIHTEDGKKPSFIFPEELASAELSNPIELHFKEMKDEIRYVADLKKILRMKESEIISIK